VGLSAHFRAVGDDVGVSSPEEPVERDVLSNLPRTRPQRRSAKRDGAATRRPAAPKRPAAKPKATATARPRATDAAAKPKPEPRPAPAPKAASPPPRPSPEPTAPRSVEPPTRTDVLAGAAEAASELVKAGLAVGGELVRVALSRLPRP
jgi:hypothetical protein